MTFEKHGVVINNNFYSYEDIANMCNYYETGDIIAFLSSIREEGYEEGRKIRESGKDKMRYFLYRIYNKDDGNKVESIVRASSREKADFRLYNDHTIIDFWYLNELSEEEAELSGLNIIKGD